MTDSALLAIEGLGVRFAGLQALRDVSLRVDPHETVAVVGPNGAGKTTFLNALSGLMGGGRVEGSARWDGAVPLLRRMATARRGLGIARTFQHAEVFAELTVFENLLCTRRRATRKERARLRQLLADFGLAEVAEEFPDALSFGLRKRLDLARALAEMPRLLLLDEPFGGLDAAERGITTTALRKVQAEHGTAIIIIDHVLEDLFAIADRAIAFDFGVPLTQGTPAAVIADPEVRRAYLGNDTVERARTGAQDRGPTLLSVSDVSHHYDGVAALRRVGFEVQAGRILGIAGANGAGKSTLGRIVQGGLTPSHGAIASLRDGVTRSLVPEGRALFGSLSIRDNLEVAGFGAGLRGRRLRTRIDEMIAWLPERLRDRVGANASTLSGGEQQMLAIARGLMPEPDLLILDEPALGLAPTLVDEVYLRIAALADGGMTVVVLEQLLSRALDVGDEVIVLRDGAIVAQGSPFDDGFRTVAEQAYFGAVSHPDLD